MQMSHALRLHNARTLRQLTRARQAQRNAAARVQGGPASAVTTPLIISRRRLCAQESLRAFQKSDHCLLLASDARVLKCVNIYRGFASVDLSLLEWRSQELRHLKRCEALRLHLHAPGLVPLRSEHLLTHRASDTEVAQLSWGFLLDRFQGQLEACPKLGSDVVPAQEGAVPALTAQLLLLLVQLSAAGLCNNDAYPRNIVWTHCSAEYIVYWRDSECAYAVPTHGVRLALIDFGWASVGDETPELKQVDLAPRHPMREHVLTVRGFPRYARDLSAVLHAMTLTDSGDPWLRAVNAQLDRHLRSVKLRKSLEHGAGLCDFVERVLDEKFLARHGVHLSPDTEALDAAHARDALWHTDLGSAEALEESLGASEREFDALLRTARRCALLC